MMRHLLVIVLCCGWMLACGNSQAERGATRSGGAAVDSTALPELADSLRTPPDAETAARFDSIMQMAQARNLHTKPVGQIMQAIGPQFRGAPYEAGTLDAPPTETLVVQLDAFDCVTYVETVLAMARGIAQQDTTYAGFARRLAQQRYRSGSLDDGYCGRLHYFSEWIQRNEARGIVTNQTAALGGRVLADTLDFMSTHRDAYPRFAQNDSLFACVQAMEDTLQAAHAQTPVRYVPQDSLRAVYDQLQAGDVVALATSIDGLDVSHTGLVYKHPDGGVGLLHASLSDGVVVSPDIQRYIQQIDHQIGIVIARPEPVK